MVVALVSIVTQFPAGLALRNTLLRVETNQTTIGIMPFLTAKFFVTVQWMLY
jgi:hypothetical protein